MTYTNEIGEIKAEAEDSTDGGLLIYEKDLVCDEKRKKELLDALMDRAQAVGYKCKFFGPSLACRTQK